MDFSFAEAFTLQTLSPSHRQTYQLSSELSQKSKGGKAIGGQGGTFQAKKRGEVRA